MHPCNGKRLDLSSALAQHIHGQPAAIETILPWVEMYLAGLAPAGRPAGIFLLLGPTGTGKTRTAEALALELHGSEKCLLRIDCGEFQMEHEVAKLIGAPPGYLGHRETHPMISQQKLIAATSEHCGLAIVLFDEIEKAAPSMLRLLLGVMDKATLHLGDNTTVNFEDSLILFTSNLGSREMMGEIRPEFGLPQIPDDPGRLDRKIERAGLHAVRRFFPPEFVNRIDATVTYRPLTEQSVASILDQQVDRLRAHIRNRLGLRAFDLALTAAAKEFLLRRGVSAEFGARELNRTIQRYVAQPIAALVSGGRVWPDAIVEVDWDEKSAALTHTPLVPGRGRRTVGRAA